MANTNLFNVFITVAEQGSITKASEVLFISQPAITKSIKQLEVEIGGALFERKNKGVELTIEGKAIYNKVKPLMNELNKVYNYFDEVKKLERGILRIGTTTSNITLLLSNAINAFTTKFPNVDIFIKRIKENQVQSLLSHNELDLAFIDDNFLSTEFKIIKKFNVIYSVIGNKEYYYKYKEKPMSLQEFANSPLALITSGNTSRENIDSYFKTFNIALKAKYEIENYGLIVDLIKKGSAVGVVNLEYFKNELDKKEIYKINTDFDIDNRNISLVSDKNTKNPAKEEFIKYLK